MQKNIKDLRILLDKNSDDINFNIISSITDKKGTILYANQKFCEISKYREEDLIGQNHRILNSRYHSREFFKEMWETIGNGNVWDGEVRNKAKDGSFYWVYSIIFPVFDENNAIIQYFSIRVPIDEKRKQEEQREKRIRRLEKILFKISHEVRQPVTQILGVSDLLNDTQLNQEELRILINGMKKSAALLNLYTRELNQYVHNMKNEEYELLLSACEPQDDDNYCI
ncbi:PAS domain-containing protein [Flavobacterium inviolabile]|uniref:PAS domain-containing protein n=1 Tax=Flavobacterium inviolabile TaxID=2748320 RepID=UPI0015B27987|nr:PAS domain-containing protein [Flavobacterium inviolabile]